MAATVIAFFVVAASCWASICGVSCAFDVLHQAGHNVEQAQSGMSAKAHLDMAGEHMDHSCCPMQNGETSVSAPHHQMTGFCADVSSARSQLQAPAWHAVGPAGIALTQYPAVANLAAETPPLSPPSPALYNPVVSPPQSVLRI
jgi:hypothetical protein